MNFDEIMEYCAPYNQKIFDELVEKVQSNSITPYLGAGISTLNNTYPLWNDLLSSVYTEYIADNNSHFERYSLEKQADFLWDRMGSIDFLSHLQSVFDQNHVESLPFSSITSHAVYLLPMIFRNTLILTTNFDKVIEKVYASHNKILTVSHPGHSEALNNSLRDGKLLLYKFHGDVVEPSTMILTQNQYEVAYQNEELKENLKRVFQSQSCLFLGCSLSQDRPLTLLQNSLEKSMTHYTVIPCSEFNKKDRRVQLTDSFQIRAVMYPEGQHECLRVILEKLLERINPEGFESVSSLYHFQQRSNPFDPISQSCDFLGRDSEIRQLIEFCNSTKDNLWWAIVGSSGMGKKRLVLEFEKLVKNKEVESMKTWNITWSIPKHNTSMNTLIVLDSINRKEERDQFFTYLKQISQGFSKNKYRFLLLCSDSFPINTWFRDCAYSTFLNSVKYPKNMLKLEPLDKDILSRIMENYLRKNAIYPSGDEVLEMYNTLLQVDGTQQRPLYALFIADAYKGEREFIQWDKKEAHDYVYQRYCDHINTGILNVFPQGAPLVREYIFYILLLMNYLELSDLEKLKSTVFSNDIDKLNNQLQRNGYNVEYLFESMGLVLENNFLLIEPALVRKYFILKQFEEMDKSKIINFLSIIYSLRGSYWQTVRSLYSNFGDFLERKKINHYFEHIEFSDDCEEIGQEAFWGHQQIRSIRLSSSIDKIGDKAFSYCENLEHIDVDSANENFRSFDGILLNRKINMILKYPENKPNETYYFPSFVHGIDIAAFCGAKNLKTVYINDQITSLSSSCFAGCSSLNTVELGKNIQSIQDCCFNGCESLKEVYIPSSVIEIAPYAFNRCTSLEKIEVSSDNKSFFSHEGVLYSKKNNSLVLYPQNKRSEIYIIKQGISSIGPSAFQGNQYIREIIMPTGVKDIGNAAFSFCVRLQVVSIPDTVQKIGQSAFAACHSLWDISLPEGLQVIEFSVFIDCKSLEEIAIPFTVHKIKDQAFAGCSSLQFLSFLHSNVTYLGIKCFYGCESLTKVSLPLQLTTIHRGAFGNCTKLTDVLLPNSVDTIDNDAFSRSTRKHLRKDNPNFKRERQGLFSSFSDDLYSIQYVLSDYNIPLGVVSEIVDRKISEIIIKTEGFCDYWYKNRECTEKWDYDNDVMPNEDICLYAKIISSKK